MSSAGGTDVTLLAQQLQKVYVVTLDIILPVNEANDLRMSSQICGKSQHICSNRLATMEVSETVL